MGQYQQWLHYREIERQLRMQVESLEAALAELQARARSLEENDSGVDGAPGDTADTADTGNNELLRLLSLAMRLDAHASPMQSKPTPPNSAASSSPAFINEATRAGKPGEPGAGESFLPTLFPWGGLPDFGPQEMPAAAQQPIFEWASSSSSSSPPSPLPQPGIELLPEDMAAFFDEHSQTDPQLGLPWWQHQQEATPANMHSSSPIDQQDLRNKHEIERWLERWRRQPSQSYQSENQGDTQHE